ncbi:TAXI family TRAP transporter solute-binding subunit [Pseudomonas sp. Z8(2022)]|jgi:TRAP transporter TAXI family solute receptor|uniref:TAXI family TRAP transporter solute-binding subunit n=1 Tax=Pseudomonas sp. Z8(2022) TaxID=2962597 RepID=UPI0021F49BD8|nr:TAXI family TRAP transporter solute-binding subunit [Pseudomonas sp. Z8(2022)]UYP30475.1 TAXI family TRAP transporter solute-binding subunit [Pseudomonas sp. Z8(2022)]
MRLTKRLSLFAAAAAITASTAAIAAPTFINVLTGGTSGVYYPIGVALSQLYGQIDGSRTSVQATKASVENLNLLQAGRGELAFALGDSVEDAWKGVEDAGFKAPLTKIRALAGTYPNYIQIVASKESGIKTLEDLKGKRISVGAPRSGTELNARAIFEAAGISYKDFARVEYMPYAESVELIKNRQIDATLQSSGLGMAAIRDLASMVPLNFVAVPEDVVAKIDSKAYLPGVIPAGTYDGQDTDVPTVAITNILVTHEGVADDVVYQMTKLMFDNLGRLATAHSAAADIKLETATENLPIPLHPGAERFYKEKGLIQ